MILVCGISIQARAIEIDLGKPIAYGNELNDSSWLIMTQQQLDNMDTVFRSINSNEQIRLYKTLKYNNASNLKGVDIYYNFPKISGSQMILDMYFAYDTAIVNGDTPNQIIRNVEINYTDNTSETCGIVQFSAWENIVNQMTWLNHIKCVINKTPIKLGITYETPGTNDYTDRQQYVSYKPIIKNGTQEEIEQTQKEIEQGITNQNELIENAFTGTYDTTAPNTNIIDSIVAEQNTIMSKINGMDSTILNNSIDTNSNQKIWTWATDLIELDIAIKTMYVIALSLGIVKLMMGR